MNSWRLRCAVTTLLLFCICFFSVSAWAKTSAAKSANKQVVPGWIINETSNFAGLTDLWITDKALKMTLAKLGVTVIMNAPKWDMLIYNDSNKNMMETPYETWRTKFLMHRVAKETGKKDEFQKEVTKETKIIAGLKTHKVLFKKSRGGSGEFLPVIECWVAPEIQPPPQFFTMMNAMGMKVGGGSGGGGPMRIITLNYQGNKVTSRVSTVECMSAKKADIPVSVFAPRTGYKKVSDEMALMMDEGDQDMMTGAGGESGANGGKAKSGGKGDDVSNLIKSLDKKK